MKQEPQESNSSVPRGTEDVKMTEPAKEVMNVVKLEPTITKVKEEPVEVKNEDNRIISAPAAVQQ